jgi:hypothetical protein
MSSYYYHWMGILAARDQNMVALSLMALAVVVAWVLVEKTFPQGWVRWVRQGYVLGGMALYVLTLAVAFGGL